MSRASLASALAAAVLLPGVSLAIASSASAQHLQRVAQSRAQEIQSPFHRLTQSRRSAEEIRNTTTVTFDRTSFEVMSDLHAQSRPFRVTGFAMPNSTTVDLELRPVAGMEPGAKAIVMDANGSHELAPSVRLFTGYVRGISSRVFIGISPDMLHGYFSLNGDMFFLSSGSDVENRGRNEAIVSRADMYAGSFEEAFCHTGEAATPDENLAPISARGSIGSTLIDTKPFLELDNAYRSLFVSDQAAIDYAVLLTAALSEVYRRDLGVTVTVPNNYVRLWTSTPPWGVTTTFGDLTKFGNWWRSPANALGGTRRAVVHLLTNPVFGGVAQGLGITCSKTGSYAISSVFGNFPFPIQHQSNSNWDLFVYTHENGHIYGSDHTFNYQPPIGCTDGSGPDKGTIMSYCHQTYGTGQVGMRFHLRVQDNIRKKIASAVCAVASQLIPGDYDGDGAVTAADVMEFDAYITQGFTSRGAQDVFDLNDDGKVNSGDRSVLLALQSGPAPLASWVTIPGSGVNSANTYQGFTNPILGGVWSSVVTGSGPPKTTVIFVATDPLVPGVMTPYGELLIALTGFGGQTIFTNLEPTAYGNAWHNIPLPYDASLIGLKAYSQGGIFKPGGLELGYAIELTLSIF